MSIERIDPELCDGCGICVESCSIDVIRMDDRSGKAVIRYPEDCMLCYFFGKPTDTCIQVSVRSRS